MRAYNRKSGINLKYWQKTVRVRIVIAVVARVYKYRQLSFLAKLINSKAAVVVDFKRLYVGVQFDAFKPERYKMLDISLYIRAVRVQGAEAY